MPEFTVSIPIQCLQDVSVEAESLEDAKRLIVEGDGHYTSLYTDPDGEANTDTSSFRQSFHDHSRRTKSWTPQQKAEVDGWITMMANEIGHRINPIAARIKAMDDRPIEVYSPEKPDVFFPYVAQAMLEDLIAELQERV